MFDLISRVLAFFYSLVPNYAIAIALLTVVVMIIVVPLTLSSTKSMIKMQRLQPEMKRIQQKYKDDRQRMNEELMEFYRANDINPVGGCLPMFIQLPIFLVLFQVIRGLTRRLTEVGIMFGQTSMEIANSSELSPPPDVDQGFNPAYLDHESELYQDLSTSNEMVSFGVDLSKSLTEVITTGFVKAIPYILMIGIVLVTSLVQQRQIQGRNKDGQINPQQQMIMKFMPYMLPVFSIAMPAALLVYFIVSNLFRVGQQAYITRSMYGDNAAEHEVVIPESKSKPKANAGARPKSSAKRSADKGPQRASERTNSSQKSKSSKKSGSGKAPASTAKSRRTTAGSGGSARSSGGRTTAAGSAQPRPRKKKKRR